MGAQDMRTNGDRDAAAAMSARHGPVRRRQPVCLRARPRRALQQHHAGAALSCRRPSRTRKWCRSTCSRPGSRQRSGREVVLAGQVGGVRRRPRADHAAEVPEPAGGRLRLRPRLLLDRDRQVHSGKPGQRQRLARLRRRRPRAAGGLPDSKIVRRGHLHAGCRLHPGRDHGLRPALENGGTPAARMARPVRTGAAVFGNRFGKLGVVASVTHPTRSSSSTRPRRFFRVGGSRRARGGQRLRDPDGHAEGTARRRRQLRLPVHTRPPPSFENFYRHSGRDEGRFFEGPTPRTLSTTGTTGCSSSRKACCRTASPASTSSQAVNSRIDWRVNVGAGQPRRARPARDPVPAAR